MRNIIDGLRFPHLDKKTALAVMVPFLALTACSGPGPIPQDAAPASAPLAAPASVVEDKFNCIWEKFLKAHVSPQVFWHEMSAKML